MAHIDWLSFTFQAVPDVSGGGEAPWREAVNGMLAADPDLAEALGTIPDLGEGSGRAPFRASLRSSSAGVSLFFGHKTGLCLVEFSGQGCQWLRDQDKLFHALEMHHDRVTRIDIAHDWETDASPGDFAALRDEGRFKSLGDFQSASGHTVYVGSRTSERYARVYRYHPPHPRAHLLRLEVVVKKDAAKALAQYILAHGVYSAYLSLGEGFKWGHQLWRDLPDVEAPKMIWRPRERGGSTLRWLYNQVTPAIRKTLEAGDVEGVKAWLTEAIHLLYDYDSVSEIDPDELL